MEAITAPRDMSGRGASLRDAGYKGETVVMLAPSDLPVLMALAEVGADLLQAARHGRGLPCRRTGARWCSAAPAASRRTRAAGASSTPPGRARRAEPRRHAVPARATASAPGSAGPACRGWSSCATPGSTRPTWPRRRRSRATSRRRCSKRRPTCPPASISATPHTGARSPTRSRRSTPSGRCDGPDARPRRGGASPRRACGAHGGERRLSAGQRSPGNPGYCCTPRRRSPCGSRIRCPWASRIRPAHSSSAPAPGHARQGPIPCRDRRRSSRC